MVSLGSNSVLAEDQLYTCGMHPQIIKHEPGDCPICGMKLTPVRSNKSASKSVAASGERKVKYYKSSMTPGEVHKAPGKDAMGMDLIPVYEDEDTASDNSIQIDAGTIQRMNLKTALITTGPVRRQIRTVGTVAYNEAGIRDITIKYEGWIEKLYVNSTWKSVSAGDALFEVYSPDLYNAELNFLVAKRTEGETGGPLTQAALARLQLLDLPASEIEAIAKNMEVPRTRTFRAPEAGVVVEKMALVGQMMKPGERIYRIADLTTVWVVAQVYESDLAFVKEGQPAAVKTTYGTGPEFSGKVDRLLPQLDEQTRTVSARLVIPNAELGLRPGMFVDVNFSVQLSDSAILVPEMAVLRSGEKNTVFIAKDGGSFEPREVRLGLRSEGGNYEVIDGLKSGERIVTSGQFMLDSESQLREAIQKMIKGDTGGPATSPKESAGMPATDEKHDSSAHAGHSDNVSATISAKAMEGMDHSAKAVQLYTCPMEEHADVVTDKPGKCPKCGMKLVPTTKAEHGKASEALWLKQHASSRTNLPQSAAATVAAAFKLPPGHPPISGVDMAAWIRSQGAKTKGSVNAGLSDACGSCGMTTEQMAAGEPCEHTNAGKTATPSAPSNGG